MSDSELETPATPAPEEPEDRLDEDDRLRPDFVRRVLDRVDAGDTDGVRELVEPLHPADMADLFEIVDRDERQALAAAVSDLLDAEVFSEMNDWVREELIDALEPQDRKSVGSGQSVSVRVDTGGSRMIQKKKGIWYKVYVILWTVHARRL